MYGKYQSPQLASLTLGAWCSLDIDTGEPHPSKRRRVRHQHFWRNSDKLPPDHRLYVASADIKQALEEVRQLCSALGPVACTEKLFLQEEELHVGELQAVPCSDVV